MVETSNIVALNVDVYTSEMNSVTESVQTPNACVVLCGYQADSEGKHREVPRKSSRGGHCDREEPAELHRKAKQGLHSRPKNNGRKSMPISSDNEDCSWIQRIYANTPYSADLIKKVTAPDDYSWAIDNTEQITSGPKRKRMRHR
jgi:hypothetical protein